MVAGSVVISRCCGYYPDHVSCFHGPLLGHLYPFDIFNILGEVGVERVYDCGTRIVSMISTTLRLELTKSLVIGTQPSE